MKYPSRSAVVLLLFTSFLIQQSLTAQVLFSSGTYSQNFDSLAASGTANTWTDNSTLLGWYASKTSGGASVSAYRASTGSDTAGALYSFGASAATDRALGSLASGNASVGNLAYGIRFL